MKNTFSVQTSIFGALALAALLVACGGGGGGGGGVTPPSSTPTSTPASTGTPTQTSTPPPGVTASGTLVDHESGAPLSGIAVGLAPNTVSATPVPQGTTDPNGNFSVSVSAAGTYLLVIGSNAWPDPNNRATIHEMVTLKAGANPLTAPTVAPVQGFTGGSTPAPNATPNPIEESGNFRLTTLTSTEIACLQNFISLRQANGLSTNVVPDEWLQEENRDLWIFDSTTNSFPAYPQSFTNYGAAAGNDPSTNCAKISGSFIPSSTNFAKYPNVIWFAGDSGNAAPSTPGSAPLVTDLGMLDPRGPLPTPTPSYPWP